MDKEKEQFLKMIQSGLEGEKKKMFSKEDVVKFFEMYYDTINQVAIDAIKRERGEESQEKKKELSNLNKALKKYDHFICFCYTGGDFSVISYLGKHSVEGISLARMWLDTSVTKIKEGLLQNFENNTRLTIKPEEQK